MKGFKEAYKSIFHYYSEDWKFILHLKHALNLFYSQPIIYEYLTWSQTGAFTLASNVGKQGLTTSLHEKRNYFPNNLIFLFLPI